jgi:hypothetical protein
MKTLDKIDTFLKEQEVKKRYMSDPLFAKILNAKNKKEYDKAVETCKSIRGDTAFQNFVKAAKTLSEGIYIEDPADKQMIKKAVMILDKAQKAFRQLHGKTYNQDVGRALEQTDMWLNKALEEWK